MIVLYRDYYKLSQSLADHDDVSRQKFNGQTVDASETAFLFYPPAKHVRNPWHGYARCRRYFWFHKRGQRKVLGDYLSIPRGQDGGDPPYIIRPVRHFGGREFYVAESEEDVRRKRNRIDGRSYVMEMVRRTREFRAFFVGTTHTTTMLKSLEDYGYENAENMPPTDDDELQAQPWNRDQMGTRYLTINRDVNDKLQNTSFYDDAQEFLSQYPFDILAIDVAYNDNNNTYTVFETNFAPQLTICSSLNPLRTAMMDRVQARSS